MTCPYRKDHQCEATPPDGGVWDCDADCQYIEELRARAEVAESALSAIKDPSCTIRERIWLDDQMTESLRIIHELLVAKEKAEAEVARMTPVVEAAVAVVGFWDEHRLKPHELADPENSLVAAVRAAVDAMKEGK